VGIVVMVFKAPADKDPAILSVKIEDDKIANPQATTDQHGRFVIRVPRDFLEGTPAFKLATGGVPASGLVRDAHGKVVQIVLDAKTKVIDLEKQWGKLRFW
jgi:hypothetical protein